MRRYSLHRSTVRRLHIGGAFIVLLGLLSTYREQPVDDHPYMPLWLTRVVLGGYVLFNVAQAVRLKATDGALAP